MGQWDLMSIAFRLDLGLYYLGVVSQPFKFGAKALLSPPFTSPTSRIVSPFVRAYNRRFKAIARRRRRAKVLGKANRGHRCLIKLGALLKHRLEHKITLISPVEI